MKKQLTVCRYSFFAWISSTKVMVFLLYFIAVYQLFIKPYIEFSRQINSPLGTLEPFLIMTSMPYSASLFPLLTVILLGDIPIIDASGKFVVFRMGKTKWFAGQMLFIICVSALLQIAMLLFSIGTVNVGSFFRNGWSLPVRYALSKESNILDVFALDGAIINQVRPFELVSITFTMDILHTLVIGIVQYCFALSGRRVLGILVNIAMIGAGFCLWYVNTPFKWALPLSHAMYTGHYDRFYNKTYCGIGLSYLYFFVLLMLLFFGAYRLTKKSSFHNIEVVDQ